MLADRDKDYIDDAAMYVADLEQFMRAVVRPGPNARVLILGHSLGAAVAAAYAERHPSEVSGLILSSLYLGSKAGPAAMFGVRLLDLFGAGKEYLLGGGPFAFVPFEKNKETHSRVRHERKFQDYADNPDIRLGYPTNHRMVEMERLGRRIRRDAGKITCPTLVLQAANDEYASRAAQDAFCARVARCRKVVLQGALHEVLIERDGIRDVALAKVRQFIQDQSE
jgi:lysophospholipase